MNTEATQIAPVATLTDEANTAMTAKAREASALAKSSLVPEAYRGNPANVLIAMEMAQRIGASVMAVMQNLHVIHGKPSFSSSFLIATVNSCGRFSPLRFRFEGDEASDDYGCRAIATDVKTGEECIGPKITNKMVDAEGWRKKNGSKWLTMPELMFTYRAAAFWTRIFAPEVSLGMHTDDEVYDIAPAPVATVTQMERPMRPAALRALAPDPTPPSEPEAPQTNAQEAPKASGEPIYAMALNPLLGKTLTGIKIASDKEAMLFQTTDGDIVARCDGDCCSHTWIEGIENTIASFPALVTGASDVDMPDKGQPDYGAIAYYGFTITTDKGYLLIDYRNESNGYYGGNLSWPDDGYYYGGVFGQNVSSEQWEPIPCA